MILIVRGIDGDKVLTLKVNSNINIEVIKDVVTKRLGNSNIKFELAEVLDLESDSANSIANDIADEFEALEKQEMMQLFASFTKLGLNKGMINGKAIN